MIVLICSPFIVRGCGVGGVGMVALWYESNEKHSFGILTFTFPLSLKRILIQILNV